MKPKEAKPEPRIRLLMILKVKKLAKRNLDWNNYPLEKARRSSQIS